MQLLKCKIHLKICTRLFPASATMMRPMRSTATSLGDSNWPTLLPRLPTVRTQKPSLKRNTWTRWLSVSATTMSPLLSSATAKGLLKLPMLLPFVPKARKQEPSEARSICTRWLPAGCQTPSFTKYVSTRITRVCNNELLLRANGYCLNTAGEIELAGCTSLATYWSHERSAYPIQKYQSTANQVCWKAG